MTFTEEALKESIKLSPDNEIPSYGSDQMYVDYPVRFATVVLELDNTDLLVAIAEDIIKKSEFEVSDNMDYTFYYGINDLDGGTGDGSIIVAAENVENGTGETLYIDLTEEESKMMYKRIDTLCRSEFGKNARMLLDEAKAQMEKDGYEQSVYNG